MQGAIQVLCFFSPRYTCHEMPVVTSEWNHNCNALMSLMKQLTSRLTTTRHVDVTDELCRRFHLYVSAVTRRWRVAGHWWPCYTTTFLSQQTHLNIYSMIPSYHWWCSWCTITSALTTWVTLCHWSAMIPDVGASFQLPVLTTTSCPAH